MHNVVLVLLRGWGIFMTNGQQQTIPGHFVMDTQRAMLLPPEVKAAPSESLTEQLFIER